MVNTARVERSAHTTGADPSRDHTPPAGGAPAILSHTPTPRNPRRGFPPRAVEKGVGVPGLDRRHYAGSYRRRARLVVEAACADPLTRCWRCGGLARVDDPWQAGHLVDGDPASPLAAEHRSCNARAGARLRHERFSTSRDW